MVRQKWNIDGQRKSLKTDMQFFLIYTTIQKHILPLLQMLLRRLTIQKSTMTFPEHISIKNFIAKTKRFNIGTVKTKKFGDFID